MKKTAATLIILTVAIMVLTLTSFNISSARANSNYSIVSVNHNVEVLYNGYVLINDTIAINGITDSFSLGFPHAFGQSVVDAIAYNANDTSEVFPVTLNVGLDGRVGFYGAKVDFPNGAPQVFSVVFVLSNDLLTQTSTAATTFTLVFPAFPSLTETAPVCNCSIAAQNASYVSGTVSNFNYSAQNLSPFTYNSSQITFLVPEGNIQIVEIKQLSRQVNINGFGEASVSDKYVVTNNSSDTIDSFQVVLPPNASNLALTDQVGKSTAQSTLVGTNPTRYLVNFTLTVAPNATVNFTVSYKLPNDVYIKKQGNSNFALNMSFFQDTNIYIDQASVTFVLPDGARSSNFETTPVNNFYDVNHSVFGETMSINQQNVIPLNGFAVSFNYEYNSLWLAYNPTMWVWAVTIVGGAVLAIAWKSPKAPSRATLPSTTLRLRPEDLRAFVDAYNEKMKIETEIDLLDSKVQKGRIPRRRYKVQKKTLEIRINTLDRTLAEIGGRIHSAGGHYSDLMRQLEIAETEIDEVDTNMKSIEARHDRGEISLETYRKLSGDYEHRKDRARTTINGVLLRLREEIH